MAIQPIQTDQIVSMATAVGNMLFPVGSYYINETNSTNPGTLLGFGTWVAVEGRAIFGKSASGTFGTAGATGGAETVTLTPSNYSERAWHSNPIGAPKTTAVNSAVNSGATYGFVLHNTGQNDPVNKLPPYVVAYVWKRTA